MKSHDLIKAARVKIQNGWVQGYSSYPRLEGTPRYCVLGALSAATAELDVRRDHYHVAVRRVAHVIRTRSFFKTAAVAPPEGVVMAFNDWLETDHADVLKVLDEAGGGK